MSPVRIQSTLHESIGHTSTYGLSSAPYIQSSENTRPHLYVTVHPEVLVQKYRRKKNTVPPPFSIPHLRTYSVINIAGIRIAPLPRRYSIPVPE